MLYVMLPAFNEEKALSSLLDAYCRVLPTIGMDYSVVLVDDGSADDTVRVARVYSADLSMTILKHGHNRGLGAAMRTGLAFIAEHGTDDDLVATMDADNTHDPALIPLMIDKLAQGADVVIASRYESGGEEIGLSIHRRLLSRGASFLLHSIYRIPGAQDYTCGYRMYRPNKLREGIQRYGDEFITENSFVCMAEILIKIAKLPATVAEVPLTLRYDLKEGASKMKKVRTILRYLKFVTTVEFK